MKILLTANNGACFGIDAMFRVPNLGLCSVAANIDRSVNEVKVVDLVAAGRNPEKYFLKILKDYQPDLIGFSSMLFVLQVLTISLNSQSLLIKILLPCSAVMPLLLTAIPSLRMIKRI